MEAFFQRFKKYCASLCGYQMFKNGMETWCIKFFGLFGKICYIFTVDPLTSLETCLQENSTRISMFSGKSNIFKFQWSQITIRRWATVGIWALVGSVLPTAGQRRANLVIRLWHHHYIIITSSIFEFVYQAEPCPNRIKQYL